MRREPVESKALRSIGFDADTNVLELELEFVSGAVYQYFGVRRRLYEAMRAAESLGAFVNREIAPRFHAERVD